jgi:hypothetical protein
MLDERPNDGFGSGPSFASGEGIQVPALRAGDQ